MYVCRLQLKRDDVRAPERRDLLVRERPRRHGPRELRGGLDVLCVRAVVGECRAHHEAGDVVTDLGRGDIRADGARRAQTSRSRRRSRGCLSPSRQLTKENLC